MFKDHPSGRTKEDVFEQIIIFTLSPQYTVVKGFIKPLAEKAASLIDVTKVV